MLSYIIYIVIGLGLLTWSADKLVEYAISLANHLGVSPFFIGVVIIGFGTSAPEMLISALASLDNSGGLAVGNALGSNIANIGLVLGCAALIAPLALSKKVIRNDIVALFLISIVTISLKLDNVISLIDGLILLTLLIVFLIWSAKSNSEDEDLDSNGASLLASSLWVLACLAILIGSSKLLLTGAIGICNILGISELIVGLTIVAIGTSLPELAASIAAAKKKQSGMIIGNIIGSNAFNTLGVLGIVGLLSETTVENEVLIRDWGVLIAIMLLLTALVFKRGLLSKFGGSLLLISYAAYLIFLTVAALG